MESVELQAAEGIRTFAELRKRACEAGPKRVGVVLADDEVALTAAADALRAEIAFPVLIGDAKRIRAHAEALGLSELAAKAEFVPAAENAARGQHRHFDERPFAHRSVAASGAGQGKGPSHRTPALRRCIF